MRNLINVKELKELWATDKTIVEIAIILGFTEGAISRAGARIGLPRRTNRGPKPRYDEQAFCAMWMGGTPARDMAKIFGMNENSVRKASYKLDLPRRKHGGNREREVLERPKIAVPRSKPDPTLLRIEKAIAHPFWTPERLLAVAATKGRYDAIHALAKSLGRTVQDVMLRAHSLGLHP